MNKIVLRIRHQQLSTCSYLPFVVVGVVVVAVVTVVVDIEDVDEW